MSASEKWSDLAARLGSAFVLVLVGLAAVAAGGDVFHVFVAAICGAMVWELVRMVQPSVRWRALQLGGVAGLALLAASYLPPGFALPLLLAPAMLAFGLLDQNRALCMVFVVLVSLAGFGLIAVRDEFGFAWMLWLALVVVVTDVAGYFAGRMIGGPKFWPRVSPKKTWSGTVAGWVGAALVGLGFALWLGLPMGLIGISIATAMASQMGDIGESAVKRRMGVKDSSDLIPGHGGLLDRFDGMLGASVFLLLVERVVGFPPGAL